MEYLLIQIPSPPPPGHPYGNHPACNTPNPPWWYKETPSANIDGGLWVLLIIGIIIILFRGAKKKEKILVERIWRRGRGFVSLPQDKE